MATVTIKFQNSLNWYIWFTSTSYQCWLNPLKTQAIFIILAVLVIKRVQRVLPKLHANRAIIRTLTVTYGTLQKNKRSSVLNLPKQRQVCPSLFFQFNMRISVIYGTLSVSCKRVVRVLSPLALESCGGSHILFKLFLKNRKWWTVSYHQRDIIPYFCSWILDVKFTIICIYLVNVELFISFEASVITMAYWIDIIIKYIFG